MFIFLQINFFLKFSSDYWGGKKGVLPPILIIGGARARAAPPPESTPMASTSNKRFERSYHASTATTTHWFPISLVLPSKPSSTFPLWNLSLMHDIHGHWSRHGCSTYNSYRFRSSTRGNSCR